jgi:hypothetical protein
MYFIIIIIVGAFLWYISRKTLEQPIENEGKSVLRFNSIFRLIGIASMTLGLFMPIYSFIIDDFSKDGIIVMFGLLIFFFGMGYWVFSWSRYHQVIFDDKQITVISSKANQKTFQWTDIKDVRLNTWTSKYVLTLKSDEKIDVHQYLTGIDNFIKRARNAA